MKYYRISIFYRSGCDPEDYEAYWGVRCANEKYAENGEEDALFLNGFDEDGYIILFCKTDKEQPDLKVFFLETVMLCESDYLIHISETTEEEIVSQIIKSSRKFRYFSIKATKRMIGEKLSLSDVECDYDEEYEEFHDL